MRVSDLNDIIDVDYKIQSLMSDLQELYSKRLSLSEQNRVVKKEVSPKKKTTRRSRITKLSSIDTAIIQNIDLSLTDLLQPNKKHSIFSR